MPAHLDEGDAHDADYRAATAHAASTLDRVLPAEQLAEIDAFLREHARLPLDACHSSGTPWGARQERLTGRHLADGLDFSIVGAADFWDDLAGSLTVSDANLADLPSGIAVSPVWTERLEASAAQSPTWLHALMLATAALDRDDRDAAREHIARSLSLRPSWAAHRLAALLATNAAAASQSYRRAWSTGDAPTELAVEIAQHFMTARLSSELKSFVDALPPAVQDNERIVLARAVVAADDGDFDELERLLFSRPFATIREGETLLSDLWVRLRRGSLEAQLARTPTADEIKGDLKAHPVPRELNLRMHEIET
jgi:hypothetical protein